MHLESTLNRFSGETFNQEQFPSRQSEDVTQTSNVGHRILREDRNSETQRINRPIHQINSFSATVLEFVSRILIERIFFQNNHIPQDILLFLTNTLLHQLEPENKKTISWDKEAILKWKWLKGIELTPEEKAYKESPAEINVVKEVFNGLSFGLLGTNLCQSVTSALSHKLSEHIPAIVSYYCALMFGSHSIAFIVKRVLENSTLSEEQKNIAEPWLNSVARLAMGFIPKVHANETGVHYHYPSMQGSQQTFTSDYRATREGDTLSIARDANLKTPEGTFKGTGTIEFKLKEVFELSEGRIRIQVANSQGKIVPVEFILVQGHYGPEITVRSDDKLLEQHWAAYFKQQQKPLELPAPSHRSFTKPCALGLATGAVSSLVLQNPIPALMGAVSCLPSSTALQPSEMETLLQKKDFLGLIQKSESIPDSARSAEVYYYLGLAYKGLGDFRNAKGYFAKACKIHAGYNSDTHVKQVRRFFDRANDVESVSHIRSEFLNEIGMTAPSHYTYVALSFLVYLEKAELENHPVWKQLKNDWVLAGTNEDFDIEGNGYRGMAFVNQEKSHIIVAHRGTIINSPKTLKEVLARYINYKHPPELEQAEGFIKAIAAKYKSPNIAHTGHGTGALIAEVIAYENREIAITVESLGSRDLISNSDNREDIQEALIVTYLSTPNLINTHHPHIGESRAIKLVNQTTTLGESIHDVSWGIWGLSKYIPRFGSETVEEAVETGFSILNYANEEYASNHPENILRAFDPHTGFPVSYRTIEKWPENFHKAKAFRDLCKEHNLSPDHLHTADGYVDHQLQEFYSTYEATQDHRSKIPLSELKPSVQKVLTNYYERGEYEDHYDPRILALYTIHNNTVIMRSHEKLFNVEDLKNYIEHKLTQKIPLIQCTQPQPPTETSESTRSKQHVRIFFEELQVVQDLTFQHRETLRGYVDTRNGKDFREYIEKHMGIKFQDQIDQELKAKDKRDIEDECCINYTTLVDEMFQFPVSTDIDFLSAIHHPSTFFVGKSIELKENDVPVVNGEIKDYFSNRNIIDITLVDKTKIKFQINKNCQLNHAQILKFHKTSLIDFLLNNMDQDSPVTLVFNPEHFSDSNFTNKENLYFISRNKQNKDKQIIHISDLSKNLLFIVFLIFQDDQLKITLQTGEVGERKEFTYTEFSKAVNVHHFEPKKFDLTNQNTSKSIFILDINRDYRLKILNMIRGQSNKLALDLLRDKGFLDNCLKNLASNGFKKINDPQLIQHYEPTLTMLNQHYALLEEKICEAEILTKIVLDVLFANLTQKTESYSVSETIQLFTNAHKNLLKIIGQDIVLNFGDTGVGKSTAMTFILGGDMVEDRNHNPPIWKVNPGQAGEFFKIGHLIGTSETQFVNCLPLNKTSINLCDSPGSGDTRGEEYQLIADLSIDQAIQLAKSVKVVLTVSYQSFRDKRGGDVIKLFQQVGRWFPGILKGEVEGLYLLVTKHGAYEEASLRGILEEHTQTHGGAAQPNPLWSVIKKMERNGRVNFVRLRNTNQRSKIRKLWTEGGSLKEDPSLKTRNETQLEYHLDPSVEKQFNIGIKNKISDAISSWSRLLSNYYFDNPSKMQEINDELSKANQDLRNAQEKEMALREKLNRLNTLKFVSPEQQLIILNQELPNIKDCQNDLEKIVKSISEINQTIKKLEKDYASKENEIKKLNKHIDELASETVNVVQGEFSPDSPNFAEGFWSCSTFKDNAWQQAIQEFRLPTEKDCLSGKLDKFTSYKDFKGTIYHMILTEKEHWLVPKDKEQAKEFIAKGFLVDGKREFRTVFEGNNATIVQKKVHESGKKMIIEVKTEWKADRTKSPSFKYTLTIPGDVYYESEIKTLRTEISDLKKEQRELENQKNREIGHRNRNLQLEIEKRNECNRKEAEDLATTLKTNQESLNRASQDVERCTSIQKDTEKQAEKLKTEQRNHEIILKMRGAQQIEMLKTFSKILISMHGESANSHFVQRSKEFLQMWEEAEEKQKSMLV